MPVPSQPLIKLGFLTFGLFDGADPRPGHESTLEIIQLGEQLGFDSAWVRLRHLHYGISHRLRSWPRPRSAPAASNLAPPSLPWAGRIRSGSPRTSPRRHPVRRPPESRHQRRPTDAL